MSSFKIGSTDTQEKLTTFSTSSKKSTSSGPELLKISSSTSTFIYFLNNFICHIFDVYNSPSLRSFRNSKRCQPHVYNLVNTAKNYGRVSRCVKYGYYAVRNRCRFWVSFSTPGCWWYLKRISKTWWNSNSSAENNLWGNHRSGNAKTPVLYSCPNFSIIINYAVLRKGSPSTG